MQVYKTLRGPPEEYLSLDSMKVGVHLWAKRRVHQLEVAAIMA
jgi:hypothetical protein